MNKLFISLAAIAACGLSACGDHPKTLTLREYVISSQIKMAPRRSLLIYDHKKTEFKWGIICGHDQNGGISSTVVGHAGVWMCGSASAMTAPRSAEELAPMVTRVITPSDPDYKYQIEEQMLLMLDPPTSSQ